jgi:ketosteroid isomerase-like protein
VDIYAPDITYFDPMRDKRIDGLAAMKEYLAPITGQVHVDSYEMIDPKVQQTGDIAVLTFNLVSHGKTPAGQPFAARWNSTEVYRRTEGQWRIVHTHWSFTKPPTTPPGGQ